MAPPGAFIYWPWESKNRIVLLWAAYIYVQQRFPSSSSSSSPFFLYVFNLWCLFPQFSYGSALFEVFFIQSPAWTFIGPSLIKMIKTKYPIVHLEWGGAFIKFQAVKGAARGRCNLVRKVPFFFCLSLLPGCSHNSLGSSLRECIRKMISWRRLRSLGTLGKKIYENARSRLGAFFFLLLLPPRLSMAGFIDKTEKVTSF